MGHIYIFTYLHISFKTAGLSRVPVRISVKQTVQHSLFCLCCRRRESDRRLHLSEGCQCPQCTKHTPRNTRAQSTAFIWCTLCVLVDFYFYLSFFLGHIGFLVPVFGRRCDSSLFVSLNLCLFICLSLSHMDAHVYMNHFIKLLNHLKSSHGLQLAALCVCWFMFTLFSK